MEKGNLVAGPISGAQLMRQTMSALQAMHQPSGDYASWEGQYNFLVNFGNCEMTLGKRLGRWLLLGFALMDGGPDEERERKTWLSLCPYRKTRGEKKPYAAVGWKSDGYGYLPLDCSFLMVAADSGLLCLGNVWTPGVAAMLIDELLPTMIAATYQFVPGYGHNRANSLFIPQAATYLPSAPQVLAAATEKIVTSVANRHL